MLINQSRLFCKNCCVRMFLKYISMIRERSRLAGQLGSCYTYKLSTVKKKKYIEIWFSIEQKRTSGSDQ